MAWFSSLVVCYVDLLFLQHHSRLSHQKVVTWVSKIGYPNYNRLVHRVSEWIG